MQEEQYWVTINQDSSTLVKKVQATAQEICDIDARLQFVIDDSFSFTKNHRRLAERFKLQIQHQLHDSILYRLVIEDIYICVICLLGLVQVNGSGVIDGWQVLAD